MINLIVEFVGWMMRSLPKFRGKGRIWRCFNSFMLRLGAAPHLIAVMSNGIKMHIDLRSSSENIAFYEGAYDSVNISSLLKLFDTDKVFLDVGANIGFYTIAVAKFIKDSGGVGQVVSFEPVPSNFKKLASNVELNKLSDVIKTENIGLSDKEGQELITLREDFKTGSETGNAAIVTNEDFDKGMETMSINLKKLDDIWEALNQEKSIDAIKIDIEGHEDFFLRGAERTLERHRPVIFMEVNKPYYAARKVDIDDTFFPLIPKNYKIFCFKKRWIEVRGFASCANLDNVFMVPSERLTSEKYNVFHSSNI